MLNIKDIFETRFFGVCTWWANKFGLKISSVRLSFIYLSFVSFGSTLIIYLIMAFILKNKNYLKFRSRKKTIWDL